MVNQTDIDELNGEVKVDKDHAQIMVETPRFSKMFDDAKAIIESLGVHILETNYLSLNCALLKLDVRDMRDIALKLTEHGFSKIKGINAEKNFE
jgi:hypothetical protein